MQTNLADNIKDTPEGQEADEILRSCVHCGFCTATCPTYQLMGSELDGPRGRIYLVKMALEGQEVSTRTQLHLDRCLTCRSCETFCPSGVQYGRLVDIGRGIVEAKVERPRRERWRRLALRKLLAYPRRFALLLGAARLVRPLLPTKLKQTVPLRQPAKAWPKAKLARTMLVLDGCVQPAIAPSINAATAQVLAKLGISLVRPEGGGCCGAVSYHLAAHDEGKDFMRRSIDAWWPYIEQGAEAIVITASGCGAMVKDYEQILKHDPAYAEKAEKVSALAKDISEILANENLAPFRLSTPRKIAFQSPCSLQHGQKLSGVVEGLLTDLGFELTPVEQPHLCCGSAGTYSILQPELSQKLLVNKLQALETGEPELIATANIGCLTHLQTQANVPVRHWVELLPLE